MIILAEQNFISCLNVVIIWKLVYSLWRSQIRASDKRVNVTLSDEKVLKFDMTCSVFCCLKGGLLHLSGHDLNFGFWRKHCLCSMEFEFARWNFSLKRLLFWSMANNTSFHNSKLTDILIKTSLLNLYFFSSSKFPTKRLHINEKISPQKLLHRDFACTR